MPLHPRLNSALSKLYMRGLPLYDRLYLRLIFWHTRGLVLQDLKAGKTTVADAVACWTLMRHRGA